MIDSDPSEGEFDQGEGEQEEEPQAGFQSKLAKVVCSAKFVKLTVLSLVNGVTWKDVIAFLLDIVP